MAQITVTYDSTKPFSAFKYARETINKLKDTVKQGNVEILLKGFSDLQSNAVAQLVGHSYGIASSRAFPADPKTTTTGGPGGTKLTIDQFGDISTVRDTAKQTTLLSFPAHDEHTMPAFLMERVLDVFSQQILSDQTPMITMPPDLKGKYALFTFPDRVSCDIGEVIIGALIHAHGFTQLDDLATIKQGVPMKGGTYPVVLVREAAFEKLLEAEKLTMPPLPPH